MSSWKTSSAALAPRRWTSHDRCPYPCQRCFSRTRLRRSTLRLSTHASSSRSLAPPVGHTTANLYQIERFTTSADVARNVAEHRRGDRKLRLTSCVGALSFPAGAQFSESPPRQPLMTTRYWTSTACRCGTSPVSAQDTFIHLSSMRAGSCALLQLWPPMLLLILCLAAVRKAGTDPSGSQCSPIDISLLG